MEIEISNYASKQQNIYLNWVEENYDELKDDFIKTLPIEEQPKTDDSDEWDEKIENNPDEFSAFCWKEYNKGE